MQIIEADIALEKRICALDIRLQSDKPRNYDIAWQYRDKIELLFVTGAMRVITPLDKDDDIEFEARLNDLGKGQPSCVKISSLTSKKIASYAIANLLKLVEYQIYYIDIANLQRDYDKVDDISSANISFYRDLGFVYMEYVWQKGVDIDLQYNFILTCLKNYIQSDDKFVWTKVVIGNNSEHLLYTELNFSVLSQPWQYYCIGNK